jgi:hypothetical protein
MGNEPFLYRRRFDWFQLVYPVVPVGLFFLIIRHSGYNPFQVSGFWLVVALMAIGQGIYFVIAMQSPDRVQLTENVLVVGWPDGRLDHASPRDKANIRKSYLFAGGFWVTAGIKSFYLFPGRREGRALVDQLLKQGGKGP